MSDLSKKNGPRKRRAPSVSPSDCHLPVPGRSEGRIQANKHRKVQLTQSRRKLFGRAAKQDFLEWFAATANLGWSARQAGFNYKTVLKHRMKDAVFAEAYDRALEQGVARVWAQQLETEIEADAAAPIGIEGDRDVPEMQKLERADALALLKAHGGPLGARRAGAGEARKQGRRPRVATFEEVRVAMAQALAAFEKRCRAMSASAKAMADNPPSHEASADKRGPDHGLAPPRDGEGDQPKAGGGGPALRTSP